MRSRRTLSVMPASGRAVLVTYDPAWPSIARTLLEELRGALPDREWVFEHIGSTAVPGISAKNTIDLQVQVPTLPSYEELDARIGPRGFVQAEGSRPDSPGVHSDIPRGGEKVDDEVWDKRLYFLPGNPPAILHVRRLDSPFGRYTVWFRDWLRDNDDQRDRYEDVKRQLAAMHASDRDYDDYTRGKTSYFDEVQSAFDARASKTSA